MIRTVTLAILAGLTLAATPALAQPRGAQVGINVKYDRNASAETNYRTITRAAFDACDVFASNSALASRKRRVCADELVDKAVAKVQRAELSTLHAQETGRQTTLLLAAK